MVQDACEIPHPLVFEWPSSSDDDLCQLGKAKQPGKLAEPLQTMHETWRKTAARDQTITEGAHAIQIGWTTMQDLCLADWLAHHRCLKAEWPH